MILYKAKISPISSFSSPLQSDTFFGAFCWSYLYMYGEKELSKLLKEGLDGNPEIIFSNAYPEDYLPLPAGIYDSARIDYSKLDKSVSRNAYEENKKYKQCTLVRRDAFLEIQKGNTSGFSADMIKDSNVQQTSVHNMVGRESGTVNNVDGSGNLYVSEEYFVTSGTTFDLYILTSLQKDIVVNVLKQMLSLGIGAKKSTGKGAFELVGNDIQEEKELLSVSGANAYIALSNFIPAQNDPVDGWYRLLTKNGKTDREFAVSEYPFKKPLLYISSGAVFRTDEVREYYGRYINDIAVNPDIVVNGCTIAVPVIIHK